MSFQSINVYKHLCIFECLCFAHTLKVHRDKSSSHASPCIFLAIPLVTLPIMSMTYLQKNICSSHEVHFVETVIPCAISKPITLPKPHMLATLQQSHRNLYPFFLFFSSTEVQPYPPTNHSYDNFPVSSPNDTILTPQSPIISTCPQQQLTHSADLQDYICSDIPISSHSSPLPQTFSSTVHSLPNFFFLLFLQS